MKLLACVTPKHATKTPAATQAIGSAKEPSKYRAAQRLQRNARQALAAHSGGRHGDVDDTMAQGAHLEMNSGQASGPPAATSCMLQACRRPECSSAWCCRCCRVGLPHEAPVHSSYTIHSASHAGTSCTPDCATVHCSSAVQAVASSGRAHYRVARSCPTCSCKSRVTVAVAAAEGHPPGPRGSRSNFAHVRCCAAQLRAADLGQGWVCCRCRCRCFR